MFANLTRLTTRLSIRFRIYLAFAAVLAILGGVSVSAWFGLAAASRHFATFSGAVALGDRAVKLELLVADLQKSVDDFVKFGTPSLKEDATRAAGTLTAEIEELRATTEKRSGAALLPAIESAGQEYSASIEQLFQLMAERDRLVADVLSKTGGDIRKLIAEIVDTSTKALDYEPAMRAGQIQAQFLVAGLTADRFLETGEGAAQVRADLDEVAAHLKELASALWQDDQQQRLAAIDKALPAYRAGFERLVEVIGERQEVLAKAEKSGAALRSNARKLNALLKHDQQTEQSQLLTATAGSRLWTGILSLVALLAALVVGFVVSRSITRPILSLRATMSALAQGERDVKVAGLRRGDEVGQMAAAVQVFKEHALQVDRLQAEQAESERRAAAEKRQAMQEFADVFESRIRAVVDAVSSAAAAVRADASMMSGSARETSENSAAVAAATEQAAERLQAVASSAEELSASVLEISKQATTSSEITAAAVSEMDRTKAAVDELGAAARMIGEVVGLIQNVASQTNLLALNATIEAARAGDAGKGFAVVAGEVKNLAGETAKATDEINAQVQSIQANTRRVTEAIQGIGRIIGEVNAAATTIATAVEEQSSVTREISGNVQQAATGAREVAGNIAQVQAATTQVGGAAQQFLAAADELVRQSATLTSEVEAFVAKVRAA